MTFNMKVRRNIFLLWFTVCVDWIIIEAGQHGKNHHRLRLKAKSQHSREQAHTWRPSNASVFNINNKKRTFIQRRIQLKGAPKGVVVNVNGEKIYQSAGTTTASQPGQDAAGNKAINLRINLSKQPSEFSRPQRKQQPIIIAPRPQQPARPVVISVPAQTQPLPQQPVVMPAPVSPPVVLPATLPQPSPATEKEENELGNILQTVALLNSLGKKEESPPKIVPVPVPAMGYPQSQGLGLGYPALQGYSPMGQNQGYPAAVNQGYPSQNQGYPALGSQNQGYPAAGSVNQGFPGGGGQNVLGAPAIAGNVGTTGAASPLAGILPLVLPMKCRCGCESRCPDLCGLCKDVDEEIYDSIDCCKSLPCPCLKGGTSTIQQGVVSQPAALTPQQTTSVAVPQNPQASTLPLTPPITTQTQPAQMSSPPIQPPLLAQTPSQPLSAPPVNPIPPVSVPPLPSLTPGSVIPPPAPQPSASSPATQPGSLPPLPPLPQITPPKPEATAPKPFPPKAEVAGTGPSVPSSSITPPKPEIVPPVTNPSSKEEPLPPLPPGPGESRRPGEPSSLIAPPPPDNAGPIKIPQVAVLPGEIENKPPPAESEGPPLPSLPLTKTAYPAPPPPPQVFIIKENSASPKDPDDSESAEALDDLSKTFEDAFTEAYKSERKKGKLQDETRRGRFRLRLHDQDGSDLDSNESHEGRFRQRQREQDNSETDLYKHHSERFRPRLPEEKPLHSNVDSEDDGLPSNEEEEEDEERMRSNVGSRRDFRDHNASDANENSDDNEIDDIVDEALDNNDNNNDDDDNTNDDDDNDGHDNDNDRDDYNKALNAALDTEPSYDADEPRHSHPYQHHTHSDSTRYRVGKEDNNLGFQKYDKGRRHHKDNRAHFRLSHKHSTRILENRKVLSHSHRRKYPALKSTKRKKLLRKADFDSSRNIVHSTAPETILWSNVHHKSKTKTVMNVEYPLKIEGKEKFKVPNSHDRSHFAHLQNKSHGQHRYFHSVQRHISHNDKHDLQRGRHENDHDGLRSSRKDLHLYSHANTATNIHPDDISETSTSGEISADPEEEATVKSKETISSSGYGHANHPVKNGDFKKHIKTFSKSTLRSFKLLLKHNNSESHESKIEDVYFNSGEESGDEEISGTEVGPR